MHVHRLPVAVFSGAAARAGLCFRHLREHHAISKELSSSFAQGVHWRTVDQPKRAMEDDALSGDTGPLVRGLEQMGPHVAHAGLPIGKHCPAVNYSAAYTPTQPSALTVSQLLPPEGSGTKM